MFKTAMVNEPSVFEPLKFTVCIFAQPLSFFRICPYINTTNINNKILHKTSYFNLEEMLYMSLVGWWFGFIGFWLFQTVSDRLSQKERKKRKNDRQEKKSKHPLTAPTVRTVGPFPTIIQIVGRTGNECYPAPPSSRNHPCLLSV